MGQGGATALIGLLRMEEVRKEVNVSDEAYEAVQKAQQEMFAGMSGFRDASEEERAKIMKDMNTKAKDLLEEVVAPEGQKRLMGLLLQQQGNTAVTNELIAAEIGLDEAKIKSITEAVTKAGEESRTKMREMFQGGGPPDREKMTEMMAEMRKKADETIDKELSSDQKKAVETLKGAKFTFPEGGGFGFGGGRGGPGGGRQRPNSDKLVH